VLTISPIGGEWITATVLASAGVLASATTGLIMIPEWRRLLSSTVVASFAGSEEKWLELVLPAKPELKSRPESGPMYSLVA
jgi:hypothetical protein